jgi:hypothetical protein
MVEVEMGDHQGMNRRFIQAEQGKPVMEGLAPRLPVGATVEEKQAVAGLDRVGVHPSRAREREWSRDEMNPVP